MPDVVLDVNVLVSGLINPRGPTGKIQTAWRNGKIRVITSSVIIAKADDVLHRPHIVKLFPPNRVVARIQGLLRLLREETIIVPHLLNLQVVEADPEDDTILIAAVEGKADCIVSGDRHLKDLGSYENIPILSPSEFIAQYQDLKRIRDPIKCHPITAVRAHARQIAGDFHLLSCVLWLCGERRSAAGKRY